MTRLSKLEKVSIGTPSDAQFSGAIALLKIEGQSPQEVSKLLMSDYGIHTVAIDYLDTQGVRITPNVYTLKTDLDRLVEAIKSISNS